MYANIKSFTSPDVDIDTYFPENEFCFGFYLEAVIGLENFSSGDIFGFIVCSPDWIFQKYKNKNCVFGKNFIIVKEYNSSSILKYIEDLCKRTHGKDWQDIATKLSKYGIWEYEDYSSMIT